MTAVTDRSTQAQRAGRELNGASATEILRWAYAEFNSGLVVTSSLADTVLIHLAEQVAPGIDVIFLDTGYHFVETIGTREAVRTVHDVNLINVTPASSVAEQDAAYGPALHRRDPDRCCTMRKVEPLTRALVPYAAWATGLRRADSPARADTPVVSWDARRGMVKIAPIAGWSDDDVADYTERHGLLVNPLRDDGYASIGCEPCTVRSSGIDARAGRWAGRSKTECGLHR